MVCCSTSAYVCIGIAIASFLIFRHYRQRFFAWFMNFLTTNTASEMHQIKKDLLKSLHEIVSQNPQLREDKAIKILEVGVGTGTNFKYYPDGTRLVVVDPNPHFVNYYNKNRSEFPQIHSEEIIQTTGDKMDMIESDSIDAVVMTLVLCAVDDIPNTLKEIKRVMAPGGKFYFMEHGKDPNNDHYMTIAAQNFLSDSGIFPFLFDGCKINKEIIPFLDKAGFSSIETKRVYLTVSIDIENHGIMGVATK